MIRLGLLLILLVISTAMAGLEDELKKSPAGTRVSAYYVAFNSGNENAMKIWFSENIADSALKTRPIDERLKTYRQMKQNMGQWRVDKIISIEQGKLTLLAQNTSMEWFEMSFQHEQSSPYKIFGVMLMQTEGGEVAASGGASMAEKAAMDSIEQWLASRSPDEFSGAVLIAKDGEPIFKKAYGWANREYEIPNSTTTLFNIGSITKNFTQLAIQKLISENKLTLKDKLGKFLPDFADKDAKNKVTVEHLLEHTAGISDFFGEDYALASKDRIRSLKDYLPFFENKPLLFEPGTQNRYSNGGYILLGLIIEKVSGKNYSQYIRENIYIPSGMSRSGSFNSDAIIPGRATGYTRRWSYESEDSKELRSNILTLPGSGSSAGGTYSTIEDLLSFSNAVELGKFSWTTRNYLGIAGGAPGLNGAIESGVGNGFTVIVLCNLDPPVAEDAAAKFRRWLAQVKK